jgi:hypothetical protein
MSVLKLLLLNDLQQKIGELVPSIMPCPSIIILENTLNLCTEKYGYGVFNHQHNVSVSHFLALLGVGNFTKVIRLCANCLQSNSQLLKV